MDLGAAGQAAVSFTHLNQTTRRLLCFRWADSGAETLRSWTITEEMTERAQVRIPSDRPPTPPGEMLLEEFIRPLGMTQVELADRIGVPMCD